MSKDFIDEMQTEAKLRFGKTLSPSECAEKFAAHNFEARIQHLKNLQGADSYATPREAAARHVYESALRNVHTRLTRINR
jgi:hypothetical protein